MNNLNEGSKDNDNINESKNDRVEHYNELVNLKPFIQKVQLAQHRIREFLLCCEKNFEDNKVSVDNRDVIVSFSGGKDSTVLLDLVFKTTKQMYKEKQLKTVKITPAYAFEITFPETISFIKEFSSKYKAKFMNPIELHKPKLSWNEILIEHGYPIYSKQFSVTLNRIVLNKSQNNLTKWIWGKDTLEFKMHKKRLFLLDPKMKRWNIDSTVDKEYFGKTLEFENYKYSEKCCNYIKGGLKHLKKPAFVGVMASESLLRKKSWLNNGCNIINSKTMMSRPLSIFKESDVWRYIFENKIKFNPKYGEGITNALNNIRKICNNDCEKPSKPSKLNEEILSAVKKNQNYSRLGCISCPYGSHLEEKKKQKNRFEILLYESRQLFKAQVIDNGIYKVLIDMGIKLGDFDPEYNRKISKEEYEYHKQRYDSLMLLREKQILNWYSNFDDNLIDVILHIENYKDYKGWSL